MPVDRMTSREVVVPNMRGQSLAIMHIDENDIRDALRWIDRVAVQFLCDRDLFMPICDWLLEQAKERTPKWKLDDLGVKALREVVEHRCATGRWT